MAKREKAGRPARREKAGQAGAKAAKPFFFRPTPELRQRFLQYVAVRDTTQQEILIEAVTEYLDRKA